MEELVAFLKVLFEVGFLNEENPTIVSFEVKPLGGESSEVVIANAKRVPPEAEKELGVEFVSLEKLLRESDFVTIHVPLLPQTHHLISQEKLKLMKKTSFLIDTAWGPLVDERALVKALKERWIAGAALDVYENEPDLTPGLSDLDNVVIVSHIGSASIATRTKMATMAATNLVAGLKGEVPPNLVNKEVIKNKG